MAQRARSGVPVFFVWPAAQNIHLAHINRIVRFGFDDANTIK